MLFNLLDSEWKAMDGFGSGFFCYRSDVSVWIVHSFHRLFVPVPIYMVDVDDFNGLGSDNSHFIYKI